MKRHEYIKVSRNARAAKAPKNTLDPDSSTPEPATRTQSATRPRDIGQMRRRREGSPLAVRTPTARAATPEPGSILTSTLKASLDTWLLECEGIRRMSPLTIKERRARAGKLLWFLETQQLAACDRNAITRFFSYLHTPRTWQHHPPRPRHDRWHRRTSQKLLFGSEVILGCCIGLTGTIAFRQCAHDIPLPAVADSRVSRGLLHEPTRFQPLALCQHRFPHGWPTLGSGETGAGKR